MKNGQNFTISTRELSTHYLEPSIQESENLIEFSIKTGNDEPTRKFSGGAKPKDWSGLIEFANDAESLDDVAEYLFGETDATSKKKASQKLAYLRRQGYEVKSFSGK